MVAASSVFSDKLVDRFGTARIIAVTMTVMAVGYLLFLRMDTAPSYLTMILPAVLLIGVGWIGFPAINIQATNGINDDEQGLAAGVLQTLDAGRRGGRPRRHHGADRIRRIRGPRLPEAALGAYRHGLVFGTVVSLVGAAVAASALLSRRGARARNRSSPPFLRSRSTHSTGG